MAGISVDHLRAIAEYNPETGLVMWKNRGPETFRRGGKYSNAISRRWNKHRAGKAVGFINAMGYVVTCIEKKTVMVHRMAWSIHFGKHPDGEIDHINGVKSDNRIVNLRDVTSAENSRNTSRPKTNSSGFMGVHFHKGSQSWHARIMKDGVRHHLGSFDSPERASEAYESAKEKFNFHENHGR